MSLSTSIKIIDFSFEPNFERAKLLNLRMHLELAKSLEHLELAIKRDLNKEIFGLGSLIQDLRNGHRLSPRVFGLYYEAASALIDEDIKRAFDQFNILLSQKNLLHELEVLTLSELDLKNMVLYQKLMNTDPEAPFYIISPPEDVAQDYLVRFKNAHSRLKKTIPSLANEFESIVNQVVLVIGDKSKISYDFAGGSCYMLWGALFINGALHKNDIEMIHGIAHESAHSLLFGFTIDELLVTNPDEEKYSSPLRDDPRPMDGIYHSVFVLARMHWAMTQLINSKMLNKDEEEIAKNFQSTDLDSFFNGHEVLKKYGQLTNLGKALMDGAYQYMIAFKN